MVEAVQGTSMQKQLMSQRVARVEEKTRARRGGLRRTSRWRWRDVGVLKKAMPGTRRVWIIEALESIPSLACKQKDGNKENNRNN